MRKKTENTPKDNLENLAPEDTHEAGIDQTAPESVGTESSSTADTAEEVHTDPEEAGSAGEAEQGTSDDEVDSGLKDGEGLAEESAQEAEPDATAEEKSGDEAADNPPSRASRPRRARRNSAPSSDVERQLAAKAEQAAPVSTAEVRNASSAKAAAADKAFGGQRSLVRQDARVREEARQQRQEERDVNLMAWGSLTAAMQRHQIINVMIATARILNDSTTVVASGMIEGFRVTIPYASMFINPDTMDDEDEVRRAHRQQILLQKLIGCTVPVIITDMIRTPDGDYGIIASRADALMRLRRLNFESDPPRIKEGDSAMADIIAVGRHSVRACVGGFDVSIQTNQLTVRYIENTTDLYYPGQRLRVIIDHIHYDDAGKVIGITANARRAEIEDLKGNIQNVALHESCLATITHIPPPRPDRPGVAYPWLFLDHFNLPARAMNVRTDALTKPLKSGDQVLFYVTRIDEERGIVVGDIMQRFGGVNKK